MKYDPKLNLREIAGNLYEYLGEVAETLIKLRYNQAKQAIEGFINKSGR
jgi:hypothetical protein